MNSGPLSQHYRDPRVETSVPADLQNHRLLRKRLALAQPYLRNINLRRLNANRVDLDDHERDLRPERFPRVHNLPESTSRLAALEEQARPLFYRYTVDLFKAAFGVFVSGYDAMSVMGDELIFPSSPMSSSRTIASFDEPEVLIRLSYTMLQLAQHVIGFILRAVFFPYVGSFEV